MRCAGPLLAAGADDDIAGPVTVRATATAGAWDEAAATVPAERRLRSIWEKPGVELDCEMDG